MTTLALAFAAVVLAWVGGHLHASIDRPMAPSSEAPTRIAKRGARRKSRDHWPSILEDFSAERVDDAYKQGFTHGLETKDACVRGLLDRIAQLESRGGGQ